MSEIGFVFLKKSGKQNKAIWDRSLIVSILVADILVKSDTSDNIFG